MALGKGRGKASAMTSRAAVGVFTIPPRKEKRKCPLVSRGGGIQCPLVSRGGGSRGRGTSAKRPVTLLIASCA